MPRQQRADYDRETGEYIEDEPPAISILTRSEITKLADAMPTRPTPPPSRSTRGWACGLVSSGR
jgi:hypothetical protein